MMKTSQTFVLALLVSAIGLTGCQRGFKPEVHKPSPLPKLTVQTQALQEVWHDNLGGGIKNDPLRLQLAAHDQLIVGANRQGKVQAWRANGQRLWSREWKKTTISSGVVLAGDRVVIGTADGRVLLLNAHTGETLWTRQLTGSLLTPALITGDRVVMISNDGTLSGLNVADGQPAWSFDVPVPAISIRGLSAPLLFDDDTVLLASGSGRLYALNAQTGILQWERRVAIPRGRSDVQRLIDIDGDPLISGRQLYMVSYQGQLVAMDIDSQRIRFSADSSSLRAPATGLGNIYVATTTGHLQAYDEQDGTLLWEQKALAYRDLSNPVVFGQYLVVGDADGYLHLVEQTEGKVVGRVKTRGAVRSLKVEGDRLLVQSATGAVSIWRNQ